MTTIELSIFIDEPARADVIASIWWASFLRLPCAILPVSTSRTAFHVLEAVLTAGFFFSCCSFVWFHSFAVVRKTRELTCALISWTNSDQTNSGSWWGKMGSAGVVEWDGRRDKEELEEEDETLSMTARISWHWKEGDVWWCVEEKTLWFFNFWNGNLNLAGYGWTLLRKTSSVQKRRLLTVNNRRFCFPKESSTVSVDPTAIYDFYLVIRSHFPC